MRVSFHRCVGSAVEDSNRRVLRARDEMDRRYAEPLDVPGLVRIAYVSEALHPHLPGHLRRDAQPLSQPRRVERAMFLLRTTERTVTSSA